MTKEVLKNLLDDINKKYRTEHNEDFEDIQKAIKILDVISNRNLVNNNYCQSINIVTSSLDPSDIQNVYYKYIEPIVQTVNEYHIRNFLTKKSIDKDYIENIARYYKKRYKKFSIDKLNFLYNLFTIENENDLNKNDELEKGKIENDIKIIDGETICNRRDSIKEFTNVILLASFLINYFVNGGNLNSSWEFILALAVAGVGLIVTIYYSIKNYLIKKKLGPGVYETRMKEKYGDNYPKELYHWIPFVIIIWLLIIIIKKNKSDKIVYKNHIKYVVDIHQRDNSNIHFGDDNRNSNFLNANYSNSNKN